MSITQLTSLLYMLISAVGALLGLLLLRRVNQARLTRKRRHLNGVLSLLILKRGVRYTLISAALLLLAATGADVLFTQAPHPEAGLFLVLQPLLLTGYMIFDFISDRRVDEALHRVAVIHDAQEERRTPPGGVRT